MKSRPPENCVHLSGCLQSRHHGITRFVCLAIPTVPVQPRIAMVCPSPQSSLLSCLIAALVCWMYLFYRYNNGMRTWSRWLESDGVVRESSYPIPFSIPYHQLMPSSSSNQAYRAQRCCVSHLIALCCSRHTYKGHTGSTWEWSCL